MNLENTVHKILAEELRKNRKALKPFRDSIINDKYTTWEDIEQILIIFDDNFKLLEEYFSEN